MCPKNGGQYIFSHITVIFGIFIGYSWGIHGVFICIGYVSVMCRLCIGYVSVMYRNILHALRFDWVRSKKITATLKRWLLIMICVIYADNDMRNLRYVTSERKGYIR